MKHHTIGHPGSISITIQPSHFIVLASCQMIVCTAQNTMQVRWCRQLIAPNSDICNPELFKHHVHSPIVLSGSQLGQQIPIHAAT